MDIALVPLVVRRRGHVVERVVVLEGHRLDDVDDVHADLPERGQRRRGPERREPGREALDHLRERLGVVGALRGALEQLRVDGPEHGLDLRERAADGREPGSEEVEGLDALGVRAAHARHGRQDRPDRRRRREERAQVDEGRGRERVDERQIGAAGVPVGPDERVDDAPRDAVERVAVQSVVVGISEEPRTREGPGGAEGALDDLGRAGLAVDELVERSRRVADRLADAPELGVRARRDRFHARDGGLGLDDGLRRRAEERDDADHERRLERDEEPDADEQAAARPPFRLRVRRDLEARLHAAVVHARVDGSGQRRGPRRSSRCSLGRGSPHFKHNCNVGINHLERE